MSRGPLRLPPACSAEPVAHINRISNSVARAHLRGIGGKAGGGSPRGQSRAFAQEVELGEQFLPADLYCEMITSGFVEVYRLLRWTGASISCE